MADEKRIVIWPAYLDSKKTKKEGRKIPLKNSVSNPKIREINQAAEKLKMNPQAIKSKSYPKSWWETSGVVEVDKKYPKRETIKKISNLIKGSRS
jgi:signal recognition particle subunit SRP19